MLGLGIFRKKVTKVSKEDMRNISVRVAKSREAVYNAIRHNARPINGLALAKLMRMDSASVTPRISELVRKGRVKVAYTKAGLDGHTRNFYVVDKDFE